MGSVRRHTSLANSGRDDDGVQGGGVEGEGGFHFQ